MKFKTFFNIYKNIIIIIWWIVVIVAFKLINNFQFENGTSLIFIGLLIIVPLVIYILGLIRKKRILKQKVAKQGKYIDLIKKDFNSKKLDKYFLNNLNRLDLKYIEDTEELIFENEVVRIGFNEYYSYIEFINTYVIYKFYYKNKFIDYTKYDQRYMQYYSTTKLYSLMLERIEEFINTSYTYIENKKGVRLVNDKTNLIVYSLPKNRYTKYKTSFVLKIIL